MELSNAPRRILVVDDDERIVAEISRGLQDGLACELLALTSGQAAREALEQSTFDVLITDWKMPEVDGLTLIRTAQEHSPDTVTILMTAFGAETAPVAQNASVHYYIEKPFPVEELVNVITSIFPVEPAPLAKPKPLVLKVVLGGDAQVGKTSLIRRYCKGHFDPLRTMTVGVDFHLYDIQIEQTPTRLVVWDMGGQERFEFARRAFYRGTRAVGLIFDASNRVSFHNLTHWRSEAREFLQDVPMLLLANKIDLPRQVSSAEAIQMARTWDIPFFESSCASGEGVPEFFEALAAYALKNAHPAQPIEKMPRTDK